MSTETPSGVWEPIDINEKRNLQRMLDDYNSLVEAFIREAIQNAGDARAENIAKGLLDPDHDLTIQFVVDVPNRTVKVSDNAGGMQKSTMVDIDYLDESDKDGSKTGGDYGRGMFAMSGTGTALYTESWYAANKNPYATAFSILGESPNRVTSPPEMAGEVTAFVEQRGNGIPSTDVLDAPLTENSGESVMVVADIGEEIQRFADWDFVHDVMVARYAPFIARDDVHITYRIEREDGSTEVKQPEAPELDDLFDEVLREESSVEFRQIEHAKDGDYDFAVEDVKIGRRAGDLPWGSGMAMIKCHGETGDPFMIVDTKFSDTPHELGTDGDMVAWCRVNDLCPDLEDSTHTELNLTKSTRGTLREPLKEVQQEYFTSESSQEQKERQETYRRVLNKTLGEHPYDEDAEREPDPDGDETTEVGESGGKEGTPETEQLIKCSVRGGETDVEFEEGMIIEPKVDYLPPEDPVVEEWLISNITVENKKTGELVKTFDFRPVDIYPDEPDTAKFMFEPENEGRHVFSATVHRRGKDETPTEAMNNDPDDSARVTIKVGKCETQTATGGGNNGNGEDDGDEPRSATAESIRSVNTAPFGEPHPVAKAKVGADGKYELYINEDSPLQNRISDETHPPTKAKLRRKMVKTCARAIATRRQTNLTRKAVREGGPDIEERVEEIQKEIAETESQQMQFIEEEEEI